MTALMVVGVVAWFLLVATALSVLGVNELEEW